MVGLEVMADQVASVIHADLKGDGPADTGNYAILNGANNYIQQVLPVGVTSYGFCEPLRVQSMSRTEEKGGDWFSSDLKQGEVGRAITVFAGRARRLQSVFLQT